MPTPAKKSTPASLSSILDKDKKDNETKPVLDSQAPVNTSGTDSPNLSPEKEEEMLDAEQQRANAVGTDTVLEDDNTYAEPANLTGDRTTLTPESGVHVDRTNYDLSGNGVTDNKPVGWNDGNPAGAVTTQTPSENASIRYGTSETVYAEPALYDDKGLGHNVPEVKKSEIPSDNLATLQEAAASGDDEEDKKHDSAKKNDDDEANK